MPNVNLPIQNFPAQQSIFDCPTRYVIVPKGRRFGLTKGAANNFILKALHHEFKQGIWVDVVNSNIEKYIMRYFMPSLKLIHPSLWKWKKDPHTLYIGKAYIDFRSAERPETIEGFGYDYAFLNEAGIILKSKYLWENAIKPMFWDSDCKTVVGGTPRGKGIFYDLYQRALDPLQVDYAGFTFTPFDNPYVKHERIRTDMKDMSELSIKQEIYAEFLDDAGVVFRGISNVAILDPKTAPEVQQDHIYVVGADLAKLEDFTVLTVYDRADNHQVFQFRFNKLEWPYIRERIKDVSDKYNKALVMLDSTGVGEPIYDDLSRMGVPVQSIKFNNTLKSDLINKLANWIELRNCYMLNLKETIDEFNAFSYDISEKTDRVFYGALPGFHDDIIISHALAVWGLQPILTQKKEPILGIIERDFKAKVEGYGREEDVEEYNPVYEEAA